MSIQQLLRVGLIIACLGLYSTVIHAEGELVPVDPNETAGDVHIDGGRKQTIDEFRVNGQLYMIRVNPSKGPSYYLVDADGDGSLETRQNDLAPDLLIPAWVLKRW